MAMCNGSAMAWLEMGGKLNGFGMRLKPSGSRGGTCPEFEKRAPIRWRENWDKTL